MPSFKIKIKTDNKRKNLIKYKYKNTFKILK